MPKYKLHAAHFLKGRQYAAGDVVDYDGEPGSAMEPIDDEARARVEAYAAERKKRGEAPLRYRYKMPEHTPNVAPAAGPVHIPENWREMPSFDRVNLARRLGAPRTARLEEADKFIEAKAEERKAA